MKQLTWKEERKTELVTALICIALFAAFVILPFLIH